MMNNAECSLVAVRDPESGEMWLKATEDWQEKHFEFVERFMRREQMKGACTYPPNEHGLCDTNCASCRYCHEPYRDPSVSRMRHISELLDEVLLDLAKLKEA